jgi:hypothetical protein
MPTLIVLAILSCGFLTGSLQAQELDSVAPVVIKTAPEAGSSDVAPGVVEIRVTFSKPMMDGSWSWITAWKNSAPESIGSPHFEADHKTCVMKVKLEPDKTYGYWLNSQEFHGFKDPVGLAAVPYILAFHTKEK